MDKYKVKINPRSIRELDHIYKYIANEKLAPENAKGQVDRIIVGYRCRRFLHQRRFGQLRRQIGEITESSLTKLGESFLSVLDCMKAWGDKNLTE